jgi:FkbM family methyltransferase
LIEPLWSPSLQDGPDHEDWYEKMKTIRRFTRAAWREINGRNAIDLPGGRYRLAWGSRHCKPQDDYEILFRLARNRSCVFDVGAKVGMTAVCMAGAMTEGRVFAFEAAETSCLVVEHNIRLNALDGKIVAVNATVGAVSGTLCEYHWNLSSGRSGIVMAPPQGATPIRKITVSLDDFVQQNGLQPDLIKIDVEGAEHQVIAGMRDIMRAFGPDVALELHAWPGMPAAANAEQILGLLEPVDYRMFWLGNHRFLDDPSALADLSEPRRGVSAQGRFLLLPQGREPPVWLDAPELG